MKLLLTSNGLCNESISQAMFDLVGKAPNETSIGFIPTAMNVEEGGKDWFINDLNNILKQKTKMVDVVDISALTKEIWFERLKDVDVLFFSGGNHHYLMDWINKSGLIDVLPEWMTTKVWVGISAGSMVTGPTLSVSDADNRLYYNYDIDGKIEPGLGYVDFYVRPHLDGGFENTTQEYIEKCKGDFKHPLYFLDDESAVKIDGDNVEVISEGTVLKY